MIDRMKKPGQVKELTRNFGASSWTQVLPAIMAN